MPRGRSTSDPFEVDGTINGNGYNLALTGTNSKQGGDFGGTVNLGGGSLTKTGSGLWELDGASTMAGLTINGGNLILTA